MGYVQEDTDQSSLYSSRRRYEAKCFGRVGSVRFASHDNIVGGHYDRLFPERPSSIKVTRCSKAVKSVHREKTIQLLYFYMRFVTCTCCNHVFLRIYTTDCSCGLYCKCFFLQKRWPIKISEHAIVEVAFTMQRQFEF